MLTMKVISPQHGPQEAFLSTSADIAIYGGAAGAGKSYALLMEDFRHIHNPKFGSVTFRREMPQIVSEGGLWDTALELYEPVGARFIQNPYRVTFPSGAKAEYHHLQYDQTVRNWDGSQIPLLKFDELQHFTEKQFFYMLSRNRSTCGIRPYVRATCNPDPDSWLRVFLDWWIDKKTGYPIPERAGVIRYMVRSNNVLYWGDTPEEMVKRFPDSVPKSVTFIPGKISDNPILLDADPGYLSNLKAMTNYEQERLLGGNWNVRPTAGELFRRSFFDIVEPGEVPELEEVVRYWDRAATEPSEENPDPDWTAGAKIGRGTDGRYYILDVFHARFEPYEVEESLKALAKVDGYGTMIAIEQDPGAAGKMEAHYYIRELDGYDVQAFPKRTNKLSYWKPFAVQCKARRVNIVRGPWVEEFLQEMEGVTDGSQKGHDDQVDAASGAYLVLAGVLSDGLGAEVDVNVY